MQRLELDNIDVDFAMGNSTGYLVLLLIVLDINLLMA